MLHSHSHDADTSSFRIGLSIALTLAFVMGEAVAGYLAWSTCLLSSRVRPIVSINAAAHSENFEKVIRAIQLRIDEGNHSVCLFLRE
jgi:hypothetical protein